MQSLGKQLLFLSATIVLTSNRKVDMAGQTRAREENPMAKISQAAYQTGYGDFCFGRLADRVMVGYANPVFAEFMTDYKHTKDARLQTSVPPFKHFLRFYN